MNPFLFWFKCCTMFHLISIGFICGSSLDQQTFIFESPSQLSFKNETTYCSYSKQLFNICGTDFEPPKNKYPFLFWFKFRTMLLLMFWHLPLFLYKTPSFFWEPDLFLTINVLYRKCELYLYTFHTGTPFCCHCLK